MLYFFIIFFFRTNSKQFCYFNIRKIHLLVQITVENESLFSRKTLKKAHNVFAHYTYYLKYLYNTTSITQFLFIE